MSTHNIYFYGEIRKISSGYHRLSEAMDCVYMQSDQGLHQLNELLGSVEYIYTQQRPVQTV